MPFVRYQSPDDPAFVVFDRARFRVEHGVFYLRPGSIRARIAEILEEHRGWDLRIMKLVEENRRLQACSDWLESLPVVDEEVVVPELKHQPAIDLVADRLIGDGDYERVECPICLASYAPDEVELEAWEYEEEGMTVHGRRTVCGKGHTIHALRDLIDAPGIELEAD
jgi:hypothetical protein